MSFWLVRHRAGSFLRNTLWFFPVLGMVAAIAVVPLVHAFERAEGLRSEYAAASIALLLTSLSSAVFTLIVFVASALLITVQLASAQMTPRVIGRLFRDGVIKGALTLCVFAFTFTMDTLVRIDSGAHHLTAAIAAWSCVVSLAVFLFLIDHVGRSLRPGRTLLRVAKNGQRVINEAYPVALESRESNPAPEQEIPRGPVPRIVTSRADGVLLAFNAAGLVEMARRADAVIELIPQVGAFVAAGDPLLRLHGPGAAVPRSRALRRSVALGAERTLEQDPVFAFRIIVDVASKALSPAVNDPTTAVAAVDCVHKLLREVAGRSLDVGRERDSAGALRLVYPTPQWPDFVRLAVTEIRHYGGESIQVARRLRAMIDDLIAALPPERAAPLQAELKMLRRQTARMFDEPEDRAMADVADQQGVGGAAPTPDGSGGRAGAPRPAGAGAAP